MFFGFKGKQRLVLNQELTSLGVVSYDYACVAKERLRQGNDFSWGNEVAEQISAITGNEVVIADTSVDPVTTIEEDPEMPTWLKIAFLISFIFNFLAVIVICLCCRYRKRNKQEFSKLDMSVGRAGLGANNVI